MCRLDERIQSAGGGGARFDMDDGYVFGPTQAVFGCLASFAVDVADLGLELQLEKCACFSFGIDFASCENRLPNVPISTLTDEEGRTGFGIRVGGVPVGDDTYNRAFLQRKAADAMSKIDKITTVLRDDCLPSLWAALKYALQPLFHH